MEAERASDSPPAFPSENYFREFPPLSSDDDNHAGAFSINEQIAPQWVTSGQQSSNSLRAKLHRPNSPQFATLQPASGHSSLRLGGQENQPRALPPPSLPLKQASSSNRGHGGPQTDLQPRALSWTAVSTHGSQVPWLGDASYRTPAFRNVPVSRLDQPFAADDAQSFPPSPAPHGVTNAPTCTISPPTAYSSSVHITSRDSYAAVVSNCGNFARSRGQPLTSVPDDVSPGPSYLQPHQQSSAVLNTKTNPRSPQHHAHLSPLRIVAYGESDAGVSPKRKDNRQDKTRKRRIRGSNGACSCCQTAKKQCDGQAVCERCRAKGLQCVRNSQRPVPRTRASSTNTLSPYAYSTPSGTPFSMTMSSPVESASEAPLSRASSYQIEAAQAVVNNFDLNRKGLLHHANDLTHPNDVRPDPSGGQSAHHAIRGAEQADATMSDLTSSEDLFRSIGSGAAPSTYHPPAGVDIVEDPDHRDIDPPLLAHNFQFALQPEAAVSGSILVSSQAHTESKSQHTDDDALDALQAEDASYLFSSDMPEDYMNTDW